MLLTNKRMMMLIPYSSSYLFVTFIFPCTISWRKKFKSLVYFNMIWTKSMPFS